VFRYRFLIASHSNGSIRPTFFHFFKIRPTFFRWTTHKIVDFLKFDPLFFFFFKIRPTFFRCYPLFFRTWENGKTPHFPIPFCIGFLAIVGVSSRSFFDPLFSDATPQNRDFFKPPVSFSLLTKGRRPIPGDF
jgi:hypothetical protein